MSRRILVLLLVGFGNLHSCKNVEDQQTSGDIYARYTIWGEEGKEFITAFVQFQSGGADGPSFLLMKPAKVFLDNNILIADSARESGPFYELHIPVQDFKGEHTMGFIDKDEKEYKQEFSFSPFKLKKEIRDTVRRNEMMLNFEGLADSAVLRVVITDTSFAGEGINEMVTVYNNKLDLRKFLQSISNGPVSLHFYKEEDRLLKNTASGWGEISITYGLKREFELKD